MKKLFLTLSAMILVFVQLFSDNTSIETNFPTLSNEVINPNHEYIYVSLTSSFPLPRVGFGKRLQNFDLQMAHDYSINLYIDPLIPNTKSKLPWIIGYPSFKYSKLYYKNTTQDHYQGWSLELVCIFPNISYINGKQYGKKSHSQFEINTLPFVMAIVLPLRYEMSSLDKGWLSIMAIPSIFTYSIAF